jgi:hypothetical protein
MLPALVGNPSTQRAGLYWLRYRANQVTLSVSQKIFLPFGEYAARAKIIICARFKERVKTTIIVRFFFCGLRQTQQGAVRLAPGIAVGWQDHIFSVTPAD